MRPMTFHAHLIQPVIAPNVRGLCQRPYPNHPKGCPNYGIKDDCPPKEKLITDIFDMSRPFWALWVEFDFASHRAKMQAAHPDWSDRQVDCCLYWQGTVRKFLRRKAQEWMYTFCKRHAWTWTKCIQYTEGPEAMGVNVTATMHKIGVELEWPPKIIVRKIILVGVLNR